MKSWGRSEGRLDFEVFEVFEVSKTRKTCETHSKINQILKFFEVPFAVCEENHGKNNKNQILLVSRLQKTSQSD